MALRTLSLEWMRTLPRLKWADFNSGNWVRLSSLHVSLVQHNKLHYGSSLTLRELENHHSLARLWTIHCPLRIQCTENIFCIRRFLFHLAFGDIKLGKNPFCLIKKIIKQFISNMILSIETKLIPFLKCFTCLFTLLEKKSSKGCWKKFQYHPLAGTDDFAF